MWLVDTSVWVDFIKGKSTDKVKKLIELINHNEPIGITVEIFQEILQGADSPESYDKYKSYFGKLAIHLPGNGTDTYANAALIYMLCNKYNAKVQSTIACLIASIAIENNLVLLCDDSDFIEIRKVISELQLV